MNDATTESSPPGPELPIPTIAAVVQSCLQAESGGMVFVQYPKPDRLTGLLVFLGPQASAHFGEVIYGFAKANRDRVGSSERQWVANPMEDIRLSFERLEALPYRWAWCGLLVYGTPWTLFWFLGDQLCLDLADLLNRQGLPVPLPDTATALRHAAVRMKGGA